MRPVRRVAAELPEELDVLVVGAGLSGIGFAVRLQDELPDLSYAIVEARDASGGTWDLFRYPGVRSDSDMFTLSFPFRPWRGADSIVAGSDILDYLRETAQEYAVDERIHYGGKVVGASWSTPEQRWTVEIDVTGSGGQVERREVRAAYLHLASGYYSYERGHEPEFAGREDFAGDVVHPQSWPTDLDHTGRRVVVIGSGATAVTLVPAMTDEAAHVVMLQRTPSYLLSAPRSDDVADRLRRILPDGLAHRVVRARNVAMQAGIYQLSRRRPEMARRLILGHMRKRLPENVATEHFLPPYGVWDQRLCVVPDGDFFKAVAAGSASVVTGHIDRFVRDGIRLTDGRLVEADLIVTATGLELQVLGGISLVVDGEPVVPGETFTHRGVMLSGVPNLSMTIGYVNASWTLRADLVARHVVRLLRHLREHRLGVAVPVAPEGMRAGSILALQSGYVRRSAEVLPKVGDREPWTMPQSYWRERKSFRDADVADGLVFHPAGVSRTAVPRGVRVKHRLTTEGT